MDNGLAKIPQHVSAKYILKLLAEKLWSSEQTSGHYEVSWVGPDQHFLKME